MRDVCMFHVKDTKWGDKPEKIDIHTLCVDIDEYSFGMFDVAVTKGHKFTQQSVDNTIERWKPVLRALDVRGTVEIYGVEFPKTKITIKRR